MLLVTSPTEQPTFFSLRMFALTISQKGCDFQVFFRGGDGWNDDDGIKLFTVPTSVNDDVSVKS